MKGIIISISIILSFIILNVNSLGYLHMVPYDNSNCTGKPYGVGFGFQFGDCFANAPYAFETKFYKTTMDHSGTNVTITQYVDTDITCSDENNALETSYEVGECYTAPAYANTNGLTVNGFVKITIEMGPPNIPIYGFRSTRYADNQCTSNPQFYYYYTNGTTFSDGQGDYSMFYCNQGSPTEIDCTPKGCGSSNVQWGCARDLNILRTHSYKLDTC